MPKGTHAGASNAGPIEEDFVVRADGEVQEVNVSTSQDAVEPEVIEPAPKPESDPGPKSAKEELSPGNSSSASQQTNEPTKPQKRTSR